MEKDQAKPVPLTAVSGGRAALEMEAVLSFPHDVEKFLRITRSLARPANSQLRAVPPGSQGADGDAAHQ